MDDTNKTNRQRGGRKPQKKQPKQDEFDQKILELTRVTRVSEGGKQMSFRACVAIGDGKGRIGVGVAKGKDVSMAITKAVRQAERTVITVPLKNETIPHEVFAKYGAAKIMMKPAKAGRGIKAGGTVRAMAELAGIPNTIAKILGSSNKINNARAVMQALQSFKV